MISQSVEPDTDAPLRNFTVSTSVNTGDETTQHALDVTAVDEGHARDRALDMLYETFPDAVSFSVFVATAKPAGLQAFDCPEGDSK